MANDSFFQRELEKIQALPEEERTHRFFEELSKPIMAPTPNGRRKQAEETLHKAVTFSRTDGQELSCTDWQDEPTQPAINDYKPTGVLHDMPCGNCGLPRYKHYNDVYCDKPPCSRDRMWSAISKGTTSAAPIAEWIGISPMGNWTAGWLLEEDAKPRVSLTATLTHDNQIETAVDGLAVAECIRRYGAWQREDFVNGAKWTPKGFRVDLTANQLAAARQAWSAQLRKRQQEAREKERGQVVCERDEDGL